MKRTKFRIPVGTEQAKPRKHLNADALFSLIRSELNEVKDIRPGNTSITLGNALMSAFAMFSLKDPSLLAFDQRRRDKDPNLKRVYGLTQVPCDTQMRDILDQVDPKFLRKSFKKVFAQLQRGKALEQMRFLNKFHLVSGDGTGYYYSQKKGNDLCLEKTRSASGETAYHQQFYGASLVHPDFREVIPFFPEPIVKQDGYTKNDCERNAARRFMEGFRRDHPHLPVVMLEDGLHSNAPHIRDLMANNFHFILGVKETDHAFLFAQAAQAEKKGLATNITVDDPNNPRIRHNFFFANGLPLNKSNQDLLVNFLQYWEIELDEKGEKVKETEHAWVIDLKITAENVMEMMRAARSRWHIENQMFNTLKNQGYHLEHNFGLGQQYLSIVFLTLTMLAFMIDQTQQLGCGLYRAAWQKKGAKTRFFEKVRSIFAEWEIDSMETVYKAICFGVRGNLEQVMNSS